MRIEPKAAFYNEETGAVQPWKDIEVTDAVGSELVAEGLAVEIGGGGGGDVTWLIDNAQATVALDADLEDYAAVFQFPESVTPDNYYEVFSGKNVIMIVDGKRVETPAIVSEETGSFYYFSTYHDMVTSTGFSPYEFRIVIYADEPLQGETVTLSLGITD